MNFNFHQKPDYSLNTGMIDELIRLYGTPVRFLVTEKLMDSWESNAHEIAEASLLANRVFGDFKTLKTDIYRDALEFYVLLAENEEYPNGLQFAFNNFGLINDDTLQVFVSLKSLEPLKDQNGNIHPKEIISNLLVFPNGKLMEITDCQLHVPGVNNKFVYSNTPSCYQLSLKSYSFDRSAVDLVHQNDQRIEAPTIKTLEGIDQFFGQQDQRAEDIKGSAEEEQLVVSENPLKEKTSKTKIDDVFGSFG
jgi:hypothetical protein